MDLGVIALVFGVIFVAELPDKSLFASLILSNRYSGLIVWLGAASAFLTHVIIAVVAGKLLTLLPHRWLEAIIALLFLGGALLLLFGKHGLEEVTHHEPKPKIKSTHSFAKVFGMSYGIIFIGEWGDITQITTANYVAKFHDPWSVGIGATLGLWTVTGLAILVGQRALQLVPAQLLLRFTALILITFALVSAHAALV